MNYLSALPGFRRFLHRCPFFLSCLFLAASCSLSPVQAPAQTATKPAPPPPPPPPKKPAPAKTAAPAPAPHPAPVPPTAKLNQLPRTVPPRLQTQPAPAPSPRQQAPVRPGTAARPMAPAPTPARTLSPADAQHQIGLFNQNRSHLPGINNKSLPANAKVEQSANGHYVVSSPEGRNYALDNSGKIRAYSHAGNVAALDDQGHIQAVRGPNMLVKRGPTGQRRVESRTANGQYVVSTGPHSGYLERPVNVGGKELLERTTISGSTVTVTHYTSFTYQGAVMENYVPETTFSVGFYSWLATPWRTPVAYQSSAWSNSPEAAAYQPYFQPEASYSSPSMWMTDQVISGDLDSAYTAQQDNAAEPAPASAFEDLPRVAAPAATPVTHEEKMAVAQQFDQVLAIDAKSGPSGIPPASAEMPAALDPKIQYYFVDDPLDVKTYRGDSHCSLSQGDAMHISSPVQPPAKDADVLVQSSMKGDCPSGSHVLVSVVNLQQMNNHCHESLDAAAEKFSTEAGQHGLPAAPPGDAHAAVADPSQTQLASKGNEAAAAIAEQQAQSLKLEADTQQDLQAGLR